MALGINNETLTGIQITLVYETYSVTSCKSRFNTWCNDSLPTVYDFYRNGLGIFFVNQMKRYKYFGNLTLKLDEGW